MTSIQLHSDTTICACASTNTHRKLVEATKSRLRGALTQHRLSAEQLLQVRVLSDCVTSCCKEKSGTNVFQVHTDHVKLQGCEWR